MKLLISLIPKFKESSIHKFNLFTSLFFNISLNLLTISRILLTYVYCLHNNSNKYDIDKYNYEKNIIKKECIKKLNMTDYENYVDNFLHSNK